MEPHRLLGYPAARGHRQAGEAAQQGRLWEGTADEGSANHLVGVAPGAVGLVAVPSAVTTKVPRGQLRRLPQLRRRQQYRRQLPRRFQP